MQSCTGSLVVHNLVAYLLIEVPIAHLDNEREDSALHIIDPWESQHCDDGKPLPLQLQGKFGTSTMFLQSEYFQEIHINVLFCNEPNTLYSRYQLNSPFSSGKEIPLYDFVKRSNAPVPCRMGRPTTMFALGLLHASSREFRAASVKKPHVVSKLIWRKGEPTSAIPMRFMAL
jgi:hypothetical protein